MFAKGFRGLLAAAIFSMSGLAAVPAQAQSVSAQFNLHGAQLEIQAGDYRRDYRRHHHRRHYRGPRHDRYRGYHDYHRPYRHDRYATCHPREAVQKARYFGMRRPGVLRVTPRRIVVVGYHRGYQARIVFARQSRNCHVIRAWGI